VDAMAKSGADSSILSQLRLVLKGREIKDGDINNLCQEFRICVQLTDVDSDEAKPHIRIYGVSKDEASSVFKLCRYRDHYFVNELTEFTRYYIENYESLPQTKYNHRNEGKRTRRALESKYYLMTCELVPMLFKRGFFRSMTFEEFARFPFVVSK
jgi:hypothetical protein